MNVPGTGLALARQSCTPYGDASAKPLGRRLAPVYACSEAGCNVKEAP